MIETKRFYEVIGLQERDHWVDAEYMTPWISYMRLVERRIFSEHLGRGNSLDIGSGGGAQSIMLAKTGRPIVSIDISRNILLRLVKNAKDAGVYGRVNPVVGSAEYLPFIDDFFPNVISIAGAIAHCVNYSQAISEVVRVTKTHGSIVVTVLNRWSLPGIVKPLLKSDFWRLKLALSNGNRYVTSKNGKSVKYFRHYFSPKELEDHFTRKEMGFRKIGSIFIILFPKYSYTDAKPSPWLDLLFRLEDPLRWRLPFSFLGDYLIIVCRKVKHIRRQVQNS